MFSRTKSIKLSNIIMHNVNLANQKTVSFVFDWLSAHAVFDITRFPALSEHLTSFHTIWGYVNCSMETMECLSKCWCSVEIAMFCWLSQSWCSVKILTYRQSLKWRPMPDKIAVKLVTSNTKDSFFWLAQMTLYVMVQSKFPRFCQVSDRWYVI